MLSVFLSLGAWQTRRYQETSLEVEQYHRQFDVLPVVTDLTEAANGPHWLETLSFRRAKLTGRLDLANLQLLTARYVLGQRGYAFVAPLEITGGRFPKMLVHLGWVPEARTQEFLDILRKQAHEITVSGRLQVSDAHVADEKPAGAHLGHPTWMHMNPLALSKSIAGLDPALVLQTGEMAVGNVVDIQKIPLTGYVYPVHPLPSKNVEYALTWYGLAVTLIAVWIALSRKVPEPSQM